MDRLQAKVISTMTNEQLLAVDKQCYIDNMKFIKAYSEGINILVNGDLISYPSFDSGGFYEVVEPTQLINNIECPIGIGSLGIGHFYYVEDPSSKYYSDHKGFGAISELEILRGIVHVDRENAIKCCKARLNIKD